ncbi:PhzF family phenazine biosynthesis protein [Pseudoalteromonas rubra]|uniref:Phenazine biosynthesis protein PhzF n=1 Tax=Pseudoalteromonas rubra TaxID=43658 RepID=A0A0F4QJK6_9GAMM|nr:PhzF family phenazine biosynthesis protein [Pseudoalteromonas rubra]KJZ06852.1 phenazine biosynthesis protein PhzF [Pseudoalteromonas rubra]
MQYDMYIVDAFTQAQFKGNSAAVVPLTQWPKDTTMQHIAAENNLSETAFVRSVETAQGFHFEIRWFSPLTEIDFCGHATLAASFVIFNHLGVQGEITFITREVGRLTVNQLTDQRIEMSFPNQKPELIAELPGALLEGLSEQPVQVLRNRQAYFAVFDNAAVVEQLTYHSDVLKQLAPFDVVATAPSEQYDFTSRYFWPANGGDEDPVTGSIHAGLAPYWAERLGRNELVAYQASQRGGVLHCLVGEERVLVSGFAVLYLQGTIFIAD